MNSDNNKTTESKMRVIGYAEYKKQYPDCPQFVPYGLLDEIQARKNHMQSLDRLNERGGLSPAEMMANIEKREYRKYIDYGVCIAHLNEAIKKFTTPPPTDQLDLEAMAEKRFPLIEGDDSAGNYITYSQRHGFIVGYTANTTAQTTMDNVVAEIEGRIAYWIMQPMAYKNAVVTELTTILTTLKKNI